MAMRLGKALSLEGNLRHVKMLPGPAPRTKSGIPLMVGFEATTRGG